MDLVCGSLFWFSGSYLPKEAETREMKIIFIYTSKRHLMKAVWILKL